eukprot:m.61369 g.61369  ORF g.61369 m.61369 type:complete len:182 (-) comp13873_c0_seq1:2318-2863(-)
MVRVRKVALMGFPAVGKSSLAFQYVENKFDAEYVTTIQDQFEKCIKVGDRDFKLEIYDTMGVTELPNFPDDYLIMDGWVMVYSVVEERSFDVVREVYDRLMASGALNPPLVIVANKCDLTEDRVISEAQGRQLAKDCGAVYLEASARENVNVARVFHDMVCEIEKRNGDPIKKGDGGCVIA